MTLEGLRTIEWSSLRHAYGPAGDTPNLIRGLASSDAGVRGEAYSSFDAAILHQGFVYEATGYTIPFLLELLADPTTPEREGIVELLCVMALSVTSGRKDPDLIRRKDAHEHKVFAHIDEELASGVPLLRTLVQDSALDVRLRLRAQVVLSTVLKGGPEAAPELRSLARDDPDPRVRASSRYLAFLLGAPELPGAPAATDDSPLVRWTEALVQLLAHREGTTGAAIDEVASGLEADSPVLMMTMELPLLNNFVDDSRALVARAARGAGEPALDRLLPMLLQSAERESWMSPELGFELLACAFGQPPAPPSEQMSERQRQVLRVVAEAAWPWEQGGSFANMALVLGQFGFPTDRAAVQKLLGPDLPLRFRRFPLATRGLPPDSDRLHRAENQALGWVLFSIALMAVVALSHLYRC
ncbi:MAG TPA: hypothetical protein VLT82_19535 [Myxococcaceae bacterium]|nr:hypothetical protein [Myxococcaceae bacterium]